MERIESAGAQALATALISYREDRGLTQAELGQLIGQPQSTVARLESGQHLPSLRSLLRIAERLRLDLIVTIRPHQDDPVSVEAH